MNIKTKSFDSQLHISESAVTELSTRLAPKGSLLVLVRGMGLVFRPVNSLAHVCYNRNRQTAIKGSHCAQTRSAI